MQGICKVKRGCESLRLVRSFSFLPKSTIAHSPAQGPFAKLEIRYTRLRASQVMEDEAELPSQQNDPVNT